MRLGPLAWVQGHRRGRRHWGKIPDFRDRQMVQILAFPLISCVTLGESFPSSALISHLENEDNITYHLVVFGELKEIMYEKQVLTEPLLASVSQWFNEE